jgi:hypothetical protein
VTRVAAATRALGAGRWAELRDVAEAQLTLLRAELRRRIRAAGALVQPAPSRENPAAVSDEEREAYRRFSLAVDRAARHGVFRPQCLCSALALSGMLAVRGFRAHHIRIGVRKDEMGFTAHAWVELDDELRHNPGSGTPAFTTLTSVSPSRGGSRFWKRNWGGRSWLRRRNAVGSG